MTPQKPLDASEADPHGALLYRCVSDGGQGQLSACSPDEGLEDVPHYFDEAGGVHNIQGLQVLLVPEEGKVR